MVRQTDDGRTGREFAGQPAGLATVFGVEMWERFSFYGMQGILLIYLYFSVRDGGLGLSVDDATSIVGAYGGAVYLSTILGGWAADRVLGPERTLFAAAVLVMAGHVALAALPGLAGVAVGLVLIALGSGGVKANATTLVGTLYTPSDPRRDAGFSVFYLGINIGALVGPLVTGLLQSAVGFRWGFAAAALGMALGLAQYSRNRRALPVAARAVTSPLPPGGVRAAAAWIALAALATAAAILVGAIRISRLSDIVVWLSVAAAAALFAMILRSPRVQAHERRRVLAYVPMFMTSIAFWALYQQQFTVLTLYSDDQLNRNLLGWEMPVSWVQAINPVFIILLSGSFAVIWTKLGSRSPGAPLKLAAGTAVMGVAFWAFIPFASTKPNTTPLLALAVILFLFTVAELLLSPVSLALTTRLAPAAFRSQMVALQFLSVAIGTALAGTLATYYDGRHQVPYFALLGAVAIAAGAVLACAAPALRRVMDGAVDRDVPPPARAASVGAPITAPATPPEDPA
jgi:POT family proton-dependent oligopeptide transporter